MIGLLFLAAVLLGAAAFLFSEAGEQIAVGTSWAADVCSTSYTFCHHPEYLAYGGGAVLVVAIGFKIGSLAH